MYRGGQGVRFNDCVYRGGQGVRFNDCMYRGGQGVWFNKGQQYNMELRTFLCVSMLDKVAYFPLRPVFIV